MADIDGKGFTINASPTALEQYPSLIVYKTFTDPAVIPVTKPSMVTLEAPVPLVIDHSPPAILLVKAGVSAFTQIEVAPPAIAPIAGRGLINNALVTELVQVPLE
jgi:hypothetical protein